MHDIIKSIMNSIPSTITIKTSKLYTSEETKNWLPILQCWEVGGFVGITNDGYWAVETKSGLYVLKEYCAYIHLSVLLEKPINEIHKEVVGFFESLNINVDFYTIFPYAEIMRAVLEEGSNYWLELAFKWYGDLPINKRTQLKESLSKLLEKRVVSQEIYHKAKKN